MKIFISWSTGKSHRIALALGRLLKEILPEARPWISSEDIPPGARWSHVLSAELEASSFGIVCLVPENLESPWVHFEGGAIAKSVAEGRLVPLAHGMELSAIRGPLSQFQALKCDQEGIARLLMILNERVERPKSDDDIDSRLDGAWPSFFEPIQSTTDAPAAEPVASLQSADLRIRMGLLGAWKQEQIIIENVGLGVAENIEVLADGHPIREASFAIRNQELVSRLRPGEEFGIKIALSMGDPERTEITVRWQDEDGRQKSVERLVTLL